MRIVMTGATSGIGLHAAEALIASPGTSLIIGVRHPEALPPQLRGQVTALPLDLADLASVNRFADAVRALGPIDAFIGNAGIQLNAPKRSEQGYELTFATNHLAHYLLVRRLIDLIAAHGRIVLTSSGTHDPAHETGIPAPHHADAMRLAFPDTDPQRDGNAGIAGRRAYSTSKLCNVMTIRELAARTTDRPDLTILAFDPGFVPGTGLARSYGAVANWLFRNILPIFIRGPRVSTAKVSGRALASLATDRASAGGHGVYWSMEAGRAIMREPSPLARDGTACAALWDDSAKLVGLADCLSLQRHDTAIAGCDRPC